ARQQGSDEAAVGAALVGGQPKRPRSPGVVVGALAVINANQQKALKNRYKQLIQRRMSKISPAPAFLH
ncbi:hypothetical protein ACFWXM_29855, partial [Achromobacter xylosoxidans]|uniref:hypothetical protein n=1 Tax=Alcaligenes xylosoxydans xylosoxydans TaxID=85698 RepID=UPI00375B4900